MNTLIWNQTSTNVYNLLSECYYTGSIHGSICTTDSTYPICDIPLKAIYSSTGMICNDTCSYPEYNLTNKSIYCRKIPC